MASGPDGADARQDLGVILEGVQPFAKELAGPPSPRGKPLARFIRAGRPTDSVAQ
jgi:hypothetical protein